ncbi:hypothetical protein BC629DRAFT_1493877 [Irpex lacteus]|nr:hypothetical protein BC629DRAFT_1493877 [Irpex lacteus]
MARPKSPIVSCLFQPPSSPKKAPIGPPICLTRSPRQLLACRITPSHRKLIDPP